MKEILAKIFGAIRHFFCLFKLTISCRVGFKEKDNEEQSDNESNKKEDELC